MDSIIYHYCDLNAFMSIINNKKLWLSSTENLNDYNEINFARSMFIKHLRLQSTAFNTQEILERLEYLFPRAYVCSFSEKGDLLSQWRAYGSDGHGVSIGFSKNGFGLRQNVCPGLGDLPLAMHKVSYHDNMLYKH